MTDDALPLKMEIASPDGRRMHVTCFDVLRDLGKTRRVYRALWEDRPIIVKVFTKWPKAGYHAFREWRGLRQLETRGLNTPTPLFCGRIPNGWAVVTERIENAVTAGELWDRLDTVEHKAGLLARIGRQLARQHLLGVIQSDLHLGNFLVRGEEIFILDPAMIHFRTREVDRRRSLQQVVVLASNLPSTAPAAIETVFHEYAAARSWTISARECGQMHNALERRRKSGVERGLRKSLRTNRRHQAIRHGSWRGLAERLFLQAAGIDGLTTGLEEALSRGRILKDGKTSFVSHTTLGGRDIVIKRYNHQGLFHSLRHTLRGSRAKRSWSNANRLCLLEIATPRPLAYVDEYRGPLLWRSYFITEFTRGPRLRSVLAQDDVPREQKQQLMEQMVRLIDRLAGHGISHGDLKHSNILITAAGPALTDLDAMRVCRLGWIRRRRQARDLARFAGSRAD